MALFIIIIIIIIIIIFDKKLWKTFIKLKHRTDLVHLWALVQQYRAGHPQPTRYNLR